MGERYLYQYVCMYVLEMYYNEHLQSEENAQNHLA